MVAGILGTYGRRLWKGQLPFQWDNTCVARTHADSFAHKFCTSSTYTVKPMWYKNARKSLKQNLTNSCDTMSSSVHGVRCHNIIRWIITECRRPPNTKCPNLERTGGLILLGIKRGGHRTHGLYDLQYNLLSLQAILVQSMNEIVPPPQRSDSHGGVTTISNY